MKKKRVFYVLERFLKSDNDSDEQQTDTSIPSDSLPASEEEISDKQQITDAQKTRRQKWIEELQGNNNNDNRTSDEIETTGNQQTEIEDEEISNITPFNIDQGDIKGLFDFSFSLRVKRISTQQQNDIKASGSSYLQGQSGLQQEDENDKSNMPEQQGNDSAIEEEISIQQSDDLNANDSSSQQDQSGLQQEDENGESRIPEQQGNEQHSESQSDGIPQNNPVKQLFSDLDDVSESIDKGHGFALSPLKIEDGQVPDSVINMLIDKFLNQRFLPTTSDLNTRRNSFNPDYGDLKWNIPDLVRHKVTKDLNKMLYDKHGFDEEDGKRRRYTILILF